MLYTLWYSFWNILGGLDYALAGQVHTLLAMTFLVSLWLTSFHDLGVASTIGVIDSKAIVRGKDLSWLRLILICCIPLLGGLAMALYMLSTSYISVSTAIILSSCYPAAGMINARLILKENLTTLKIIGFLIVLAGIYFTTTASLPDHLYSTQLVGVAMGVTAAILWGVEGVIYKSILNHGVPENTLLFVRKISTIFLFFPLTWYVATTVNPMILLLMFAIGIVGYIADLMYMKAFKHSNFGLAMSLNITYTIWGILSSALIFNVHVEVGSTVIAALLIIAGNCLIIKSRHSKS